MKKILLLGAGFSRNWEGWLGSEVAEYLLGHPLIDEGQRELLFEYRSGGFERALAQLQQSCWSDENENSSKELENFQSALREMYSEMNQAFGNQPSLEFDNNIPFSVKTFLAKFDVIYTLNQDLLLECHYMHHDLSLLGAKKQNHALLPGMKKLKHSGAPTGKAAIEALSDRWEIDDLEFQISGNAQSIFKLHGSCNWVDPDHRDLMIMGGGKKELIDNIPILKRYFEIFREHLLAPDARLMTIGYSFRDCHVNEVILEATQKEDLELFVIDPKGLGVLEPNTCPNTGNMIEALWPRVIGASRRPLSEIFHEGGEIEHKKVMRFFL